MIVFEFCKANTYTYGYVQNKCIKQKKKTTTMFSPYHMLSMLMPTTRNSSVQNNNNSNEQRNSIFINCCANWNDPHSFTLTLLSLKSNHFISLICYSFFLLLFIFAMKQAHSVHSFRNVKVRYLIPISGPSISFT